MSILQTIAANKRKEVEAAKAVITPERMSDLAKQALTEGDVARSLSQSICRRDIGIIAEFKRRSPSKGDIAPMAEVEGVIPLYERGGAAGCSVLTDTPFFGGAVTDLMVARSVTSLPLLRKEFIIDEYQIYQARLIGADAVLLIASLLSKDEICRFTETAHSLSLEVLLELHGEEEIGKICADADLIGVNNRDLANFHTDLAASMAMIGRLPSNAVKVAESGIKSREDILRLRDAGFRGFLIGETLMASGDPAAKLIELTS